MGIFSSIKDAIFGHKTADTAGMTTHEVPVRLPDGVPAPASASVDVEAVLVDIAQQKGNPDLNWRTSIVDLMKLLDLDSSLDNRKTLATELGYTGEKNGSAEMNIWLHKAVMDELAKNGGHVPASLKG